jgi:hypothetical protein
MAHGPRRWRGSGSSSGPTRAPRPACAVPSEGERHTTAADPRSRIVRGGAGKRVEWSVKAISPLLRSEFAQSTPAVRRTAISRTVSSQRRRSRSSQTEQPDAAIGDPRWGRSAHHAEQPLDRAAADRSAARGAGRFDAEGALSRARSTSSPALWLLSRTDGSRGGRLLAVREPLGRAPLPSGTVANTHAPAAGPRRKAAPSQRRRRHRRTACPRRGSPQARGARHPSRA